ncbi:MAG: bifunctional nuclease family protein [Desulfobacterota bacterium]|nr:bifunctional nuclease family protein [Thermodesulfobacteriota bacterium]
MVTDMPDDLIEVFVKESAPDYGSGQYKVVLQDKQTNKILSIWVGHFEGSAIALGLEEAWTPRPMTHDLIASMLTALGARVLRVVVTDLKENTFFAVICIEHNNTVMNIDSRPSDALALAVRLKCPVYVSSRITDKMADEIDDLFERLQPRTTIH